MDGYVEERRAYVAEIRNSFDEGRSVADRSGRVTQEDPYFSLGVKVRLFLSIVLLCLFLGMKLTGMEIRGYNAADVIDKITENSYTANLQDKIYEAMMPD